MSDTPLTESQGQQIIDLLGKIEKHLGGAVSYLKSIEDLVGEIETDTRDV